MATSSILLGSCLADNAQVVTNQKPNFLFIAIDDLRPELGCYGDRQVKSPNIDRLASEGVVFSRAYCNIPVCGASRASLMTGIYPTAKRFVSFSTRADVDTPEAVTLPGLLKNNGYTTLSNGKVFHHLKDCDAASWSESAWRPEIGGLKSYDPETVRKLSERKRGRIYEHPEVADNAYPDGMIAEKTIADLNRLKEEGKPFFMACGLLKPHLPFYAPKRYWDIYDRDKLKLADNRFRPKNAPDALKGSSEFKSYELADFEINSDRWHRMMLHGYLACVSYVDKLVGDIIAELKRLELYDNTVIVLWGDHGWHLGEHNFWGKHNTLDHALRVPLIVKAPGKSASVSSEAMVETVDIYPTVCKLAGLDGPKQLQGRSFAPVLDNPDSQFRDHVYTRYGKGDAVVTPRYAFTRYSEKNPGRMLYDHQIDPEENENVVEQPKYKETAEMLEKMLDNRIKESLS